MTTLSQPQDGNIPRPILLAIGGVVLLTLVLVGAVRLTGTPPSAIPAVSAIQMSHLMVLQERPGGGVIIRDPQTGEIERELLTGEDGFVRGVLRVLNRVRMQYGQPTTDPWRVTRWDNGRLSLDDPKSGWSMELTGFGPSNYATFAKLLVELETPK